MPPLNQTCVNATQYEEEWAPCGRRRPGTIPEPPRALGPQTRTCNSITLIFEDSYSFDNAFRRRQMANVHKAFICRKVLWHRLKMFPNAEVARRC